MQENELPSGNQQLARQRTEWAVERTKLANERTLVAWLLIALLVGFPETGAIQILILFITA